jgi:hypothetical protein
VVNPASRLPRNLELHAFPCYCPVKCQGNGHTCIRRTQGSHCSTGNRRCKLTGLQWPSLQYHCTVLPEPQDSKQVPELPLPTALFSHDCSSSCGSWKPAPGKQAPRLLLPRLGSPVLAALLHCPPGACTQQAGPINPDAHRLGSPMPAAAAVAPESPCPNTSRPQGLCCLLDTR